MSRLLYSIFIGIVFSLSGCGKSDISKKLEAASPSDGGDKHQTNSIISQAEIKLWGSPVRDGNRSGANASMNLDTFVTKRMTSLPNLMNKAGLENTYLKIKNASNDSYLANYSNYSSTKSVAWTNKDFQHFMAYASFTKSIEKARTQFASFNITSQKNGKNQSLFPLTVFAVEPSTNCSGCNATSTGYSPDGRNIKFYKHGADGVEAFNMIDEEDVAHHEFGHVLQHSLNRVVLENYGSENPSIDALLEGMADFWSASVLKIDNIFLYLSNNINEINKNYVVRYSHVYNRQINQNLKFPDNYISQAHMDGRIVAIAMNDVRKYFEDNANLPSGCTGYNGASSCQKNFSLSREKAFEEASKMAFVAYSKMLTSSTLYYFAWLVIDEWYNTTYKALCPSQSQSCRTNTLSGLVHIFKNRGLYNDRKDMTDVKDDLKANLGRALESQSELKFIPFPGMSNSNSTLEPCETVMVVPNIKNISNGYTYPLDWVDGSAKLKAIWGFSEPDGNLERVKNSNNQYVSILSNTKVIPWLQPGEDVYSLVSNTSSRIYNSSSGSSFLKPLTANDITKGVGWILKAPPSGEAKIKYKMKIRPYNARTYIWADSDDGDTNDEDLDYLYHSINVNTAAGAENFCD